MSHSEVSALESKDIKIKEKGSSLRVTCSLCFYFVPAGGCSLIMIAFF